MRILLTFLFLLIATQAQSVELAVKAKEHWQSLANIPAGTTQDTIAWLKDVWLQKHKGEIVAVMPNGTTWGRLDAPPNYVIIKVPNATMGQASKYISPLIDTLAVNESDSVRVKERRWHFLRKVVDSALTLWGIDSSYVILTNAQAVNIVREYNVTAIKQKIINRLRQ